MERPNDITLPDFRVDDPASTEGIVMEGLTKTFQERKVLDGLDFTIRRRETVVAIGRSGEGTSVLLKHIARPLDPEQGQVWLDG
nr:ATP-binding cassette domain-containing protein [bacterium]